MSQLKERQHYCPNLFGIVQFKHSRHRKSGKIRTCKVSHITKSKSLKAAAMSRPPSTAPTIVRRSGHCGASATIRWTGHGMAARLSAPIMPSVRHWCAGSERLAGSAACSKRHSTALSGSCGSAVWRIRHIRINIEKNQKRARSNDLARFVYWEETQRRIRIQRRRRKIIFAHGSQSRH